MAYFDGDKYNGKSKYRPYATLGDFKFRIDPENISYNYQIDYVTIPTIGGQVVQVLGATTSDITIKGSYGEQRGSVHKQSWQLGEEFNTKIRQLMDRQLLPGEGSGSGPVHEPMRFTFMDGFHNWDFLVLVKSLADASGSGSIEHSAGKFDYEYVLTLFLVQDNSLSLKKIATDQFISRIATNGLGWKNTTLKGDSGSFEGSNSIGDAASFIRNTSPDGTFDGYLTALLAGTTIPPASNSKAAPAPVDEGGLLPG